MFIQVSCQTFGIRNFFSPQETACRTDESPRTAPIPHAVMTAWENGHGDLARSGEISGSLGIKFAATVRPRRRLRCRLRKRFAFVARENRYPPIGWYPEGMLFRIMLWGSRRTGCSSYRAEGGSSPA